LSNGYQRSTPDAEQYCRSDHQVELPALDTASIDAPPICSIEKSCFAAQPLILGRYQWLLRSDSYLIQAFSYDPAGSPPKEISEYQLIIDRHGSNATLPC